MYVCAYVCTYVCMHVFTGLRRQQGQELNYFSSHMSGRSRGHLGRVSIFCTETFMSVFSPQVRMYVCMCVFVCMYVYMHASMYVCMYVCMYV